MKIFIRFLAILSLTIGNLSAGETTTLESISGNPFVIPKEKVQELISSYGIDTNQLLLKLIPIAQLYARPPISGYKVGVAGLGKSGAIYLGVNLEFKGIPLNEAVHGEQFLVANARSHGEEEIVAIALSAAPCGHCRQFLHEMGNSDRLLILTLQSEPRMLATLLPESFGPVDLGIKALLMFQEDLNSFAEESPSLEAHALQAAFKSYTPYSASPSGVALQTKNGSIYTGSYLENAAYNPSLSPLQVALVNLVVGMENYDDITDVVLAEQKNCTISQSAMSSYLLHVIAPNATFSTIEF